MKNKILFASAALLGIAAIGGIAVASANSGIVSQVKADEISPHTITTDMYEIALTESYSHHDHPIEHSRYLLGDWLYGNGEMHNVTLDLKMEIEETPSTWKFNLVKGYLKGGTTRYTTLVRASNSSGTYNICNTTDYTAADNPDEYAIGQLLTGKGAVYGGAMISTQIYKNITDLSFYWRYTESKGVYVCYQLNGEGDWKILENSGNPNGNYSGTRGWDTHGYTTFNFANWESEELYGANARIALAVGGTTACDVQLGGVLINANKAAVKYLNALSYRDGFCDSESYYDLNKGQTNDASNRDAFQLATERAEGSFLANYITTGGKTSEYYILGLYNHLVSSVPGLGNLKTANSNVFNLFGGNNADATPIAFVSIAAVSIAASGIMLAIKKRKHN